MVEFSSLTIPSPNIEFALSMIEKSNRELKILLEDAYSISDKDQKEDHYFAIGFCLARFGTYYYEIQKLNSKHPILDKMSVLGKYVRPAVHFRHFMPGWQEEIDKLIQERVQKAEMGLYFAMPRTKDLPLQITGPSAGNGSGPNTAGNTPGQITTKARVRFT